MEGGEIVQELYAYAVHLSREYSCQRVEAEDFLQEILIVFLRVTLAHSGRLDRTRLIKLAKIAARNRIKDLLRHRKIVREHHADLEEAEEVGEWAEERRHIVKDLVGMILKRMKDKDRKVLEMLLDGMSVNEIVTGRTVSRRTLYRSIEKARAVATANNWIETGGKNA